MCGGEKSEKVLNDDQCFQWQVTYDGNFWGNPGPAGREIPVGKCFSWGNESWFVPAVYLCDKGLVTDLCLCVDAEEIKAFIHRWNLLDQSDREFSLEEQERIQNENPLNAEIAPSVILNGASLGRDHSCGISWIPESCGAGENQEKAENVLRHYKLDPSFGWAIHRQCFLWPDAWKISEKFSEQLEKSPETLIKSLELSLEREPVQISGVSFSTPKAGDVISFTHPVTLEKHQIKVHRCEIQQISQDDFHDKNVEYPTWYQTMVYTMDPELSDREFILRDAGNGDGPRIKMENNGEGRVAGAAAIAVIGGADGTATITLPGETQKKSHAACSSLYFHLPDQIRWIMYFFKKPVEDITVTLV